ncbi:hypothetical protein [Teredinibacter waterburyi]|jgi:hypothetical protein|uniref:hypothetical protein n=1 Tax=Teredinibacter waterburyi TaxID=1500538 RepID=UPI00165F0486|nr:hypothetical protein [Teredinibacter waterburyi]
MNQQFVFFRNNLSLARLALVAMTTLFVAGCGEAQVGIQAGYHDDHYDTSYYETDSSYHAADGWDDPFAPELLSVELIDSYGDSSADTPIQHLSIDPYIDDGLFELFWRAEAWDDYWAELYINDRPSFDGALFVDDQLCGLDLACDEDGVFFCQYTPGFTVLCDSGDEVGVVSISDLMLRVPEKLYVGVQLCDLYFETCEYQWQEVWFE